MNARTIQRDVFRACIVTATLGIVLVLGWTLPLERPIADLFMRLANVMSSADSQVAAVVIDDRAVKELGPAPWPRQTLAALVSRISEHGPRVIVIDILLSEPRDDDGDMMLEESLQNVDAVFAAALSSNGGWLLPVERFGGARSAAHSHAETDTDGVVRSIAYTKQADGLALSALSISAALRGGWQGSIAPGRRFLPDFRETPGEVLQIGATDLLDGEGTDDHSLKDRIVFVGYSAAGTTDEYFVPVGERNRPTPGVLVHAAATSSLLRNGLLKPIPLWLILALVFSVALSVQLFRTQSGRFRFAHVLVVVVFVVAVTFVALWVAHLLLPTVALFLVAFLSVGLREAVESKQAQTETGAILTSLLAEEGLERDSTVPRGVHGRLKLVRDLQDRIAQDRNLRRILLEGMNEGVVLWDATGNPQLSNRALVDLWGHRPTVQEVQTAQSEAEVGNDASGSREVRRGRRTLEIEVLEVTGGSLGLIRDATERFELDRRRREMHRLVSHELKTPLASISGFGEMLQTYEMSGEELDNVAGMIRTEADRLSELVRAFLDIERLGTDQWETERTTVDLVPVIGSRIKALTPVAEARGQTLDLRIDGTPRINGVVQLISQLVENLVGNAIKYSPDGGKIGVELGQSGDGDSWLRVRDKGIGIPHEAIPHLFERFYRVPGTETEGSGLGLAFVKEVADRHGATVHVESEEGVGASFTVVFPPSGVVE